MKYLKNKRVIYILILAIICLVPIVISTTYAAFVSSYVSDEEFVEMNLSFDVAISSIDEYHELEISPGGTLKFNVQIENASEETAYYGVWYKMYSPSELPSDGSIQIGKIADTTGTSSGEIAGGENVTASFAIVNSTNSDVIIYIGIASSTTSTSDIEYLNGKYLITGEVEFLRDIIIKNITIDGVKTDSFPTEGFYTMDYTCSKGSTLRWDNLAKAVIYEKGSKVGDKCSVTFTSSTEYPLLNTMPVGSYVKYVGEGGTVGSTSVACQTGGPATDSTLEATAETEAPNSCLGQNAREDIDTNGNTYGYCYDKKYKYYTTGWRIAYIDSNNKPVIISAGSPECNSRESIKGNITYIKKANTKAIKYCNSDYVDGDCSCLDSDSDGYCDCTDSDSDGLCDEVENNTVDAWAVSDIDFYNMTKAISGVGKRLYSRSSSLGDSGGTLGSTLYCYGKYSYEECGYNNDLLDNGGYYWFSARYSSSSTNGVFWSPYLRYVSYSTFSDAYGFRPVISLQSTVYVIGGSGTIDDPYEIGNLPKKEETGNLASTYVINKYNDGSSITTVNIGGDTSKPQVHLNATQGIMLDNNGEYRYYGANPNNYVSYNDELWRIISVGNVKSSATDTTGETRVKIVKADILTDDNGLKKYSWDSSASSVNSGNGVNDWSKSDLMTELNTLYLNSTSGTCYTGNKNATTACNFTNTGLSAEARNLTADALYYLGGNSTTSGVYPNDYYTFERGTTVWGTTSGQTCNDGACPRATTWIGRVGIIYPSDYAYATDLSVCTKDSYNYDNANCKNNDWLLDTSDHQWTISPFSFNAGNAFIVTSSGYVSNFGVNGARGVRAVQYLRSEVTIVEGEGTSTNPYKLGT